MALPFDQRGAIYARVHGGRVDIGAFEAQPQHADFDEDGDVDGVDFLAWQIGFGTTAPDAVKGDGDADNDTDVDVVDLAAWENAYGASGELSGLSSQVSAGESTHLAISADEGLAALSAVATVDTQFDTIDFNDGLTSLREAIFATNTLPGADRIEFAPYLNGVTIRLDLSLGEMKITDSLTIDASALAAGIVVDARQGADGIYATGDGIRIFNIDDFDIFALKEVELIGLSITGGDTSSFGGAIANRENLKVTSTKVYENASLGPGGGIHSRLGSLSLTDSYVAENTTRGVNASGGGVYAEELLTINRSVIDGNWTQGNNSDGGGIRGFDVTLVDSVVSGNFTIGAFADGGGIYVGNNLSMNPSPLSITNSSISENLTHGSGSRGGGIWALQTTITASTISGNNVMGSAGYGGGVFSPGTVTLTNSTVSGNAASRYGGGLAVRTANIAQSTITQNSAYFGGGMSGRTLFLSNSIVARNSAVGQDDVYLDGGLATLSASYSLIGDGTGVISPGGTNLVGTTASPIDPVLGPLADNGGPTKTHALLGGSPAFDAGDPGFDPADPDGDPLTDDAAPFDQRGNPFERVYTRIDMGAYERAAPSADFDKDGDTDGLDFLGWQIGFGTAPDAVKGDGDADNDTDVDVDDLAAWGDAYGLAVELSAVGCRLAAAEDHPSLALPIEGRESGVLTARLVDLAMGGDGTEGTSRTDETYLEVLALEEVRVRDGVALGPVPRGVVGFGDVVVSRRGDAGESGEEGLIEGELVGVGV